MSFEPFRTLQSRTVVLPEDNIDTDQIIPARFLTTTDKAGLGGSLFYDWRYDQEGNLISDHILNTVNPDQHQVLVAGDNFGCGSSREHAPWALAGFGFRAVISTSIADIFRSNALKNGVLPVVVASDVHRALLEEPGRDVTIDLDTNELRFGNHVAEFHTEAFARRCLLDGTDPLGFLLSAIPDIETFEAQRAS